MELSDLVRMYVSQHYLTTSDRDAIIEYVKPLIEEHSYFTLVSRYYNPRETVKRCSRIVRFFYNNFGIAMEVGEIIPVYIDLIDDYFSNIYDSIRKDKDERESED